MLDKIRMLLTITILSSSGLYIGFEAGKNFEYLQAERERITFNKLVKHQEHFFRWKLGELDNWQNQLKQDSTETARLK